MTGLVRRATLITAAGLLAATGAMAGVPSASTSTQPAGLFMKILGQSAGAQDPGSNFSYTIRDASNNAVPGAVVILNASACTDVRICSSPQPTATPNCGAKTVSAVTNGAGQVTFGIIGASGPGAAVLAGSCVSVTADGVPMSNLHPVTGDYDGVNGINALDVSACFGDANAGTNRRRSDHDNNGIVNALDVSAEFGLANAGGSPASCTTLCP